MTCVITMAFALITTMRIVTAGPAQRFCSVTWRWECSRKSLYEFIICGEKTEAAACFHLQKQTAAVCDDFCEDKRQASDSIFINGITGQIDLVIPIDTGSAFVKLYLLKQAVYGCQVFIAFDVFYIFFCCGNLQFVSVKVI